MATPTKTLAEAYDGMLSRDWEKLIAIFQRGENRAVLMTDMKTGEQYGSSAHDFITEDSFQLLQDLESRCIGFFPTQEDLT